MGAGAPAPLSPMGARVAAAAVVTFAGLAGPAAADQGRWTEAGHSLGLRVAAPALLPVRGPWPEAHLLNFGGSF